MEFNVFLSSFFHLAVGPSAAGREVKISSPFLKYYTYRLFTNATNAMRVFTNLGVSLDITNCNEAPTSSL